MTIGFSSAVCPGWDLQRLLGQAQALGFTAVEIAATSGQSQSSADRELTDVAGAASAFKTAGVQLLCLRTDSEVGTADRHSRERNEAQILKALELASQLGSPYATVRLTGVPPGHDRDRVLFRIVEALRRLAPEATERNVAILVENGGTFSASRDLWLILDAVEHPAVRCCWNPCHSIVAGESHTLAVPRIGRRTAITHMMDAILRPSGGIQNYIELGQGQLDLARYLLLMRGIGADTHLVVDAPPEGISASPVEYLTAAKNWLDLELKRLDDTSELSAYKGDKNAPRFAVHAPKRAAANG
jgi:sugar phosphate isomerase/epimerase